MLASFGFYAKTEEAAEHSHAHCDCRIVPDFDGATTVKGYDPDGMYERHNDCSAALGGRTGIASDWYAMPEDERDALVRRHGNRGGKRTPPTSTIARIRDRTTRSVLVRRRRA